MFKIQWRSNEGYGDFITGLCYAYSSVIKYQQPAHITFHWPNPYRHLLSKEDQEPIIDRFNYINTFLKPVKGLTIEHFYSSVPPYRYINVLEEFNHLHGLWYLNQTPAIIPKLVVLWSSRHNLKFPGLHKDPLYHHWDKVRNIITDLGYTVEEVTYRTPVEKVMRLITSCEFGVGYEGMIHQLFKFTWRPFIVASERVSLSKLLAPQGHIISRPEQLLKGDILGLVERSKANIQELLVRHRHYMEDVQDPTKHLLYNRPSFFNTENED